MIDKDQAELERSRDGMELSTGDSFKKFFNIIANEAHDVGFENACSYKDKRIAELKAVLKDVVIPYIDPVDTDVLEPVVKVLEGGADE